MIALQGHRTCAVLGLLALAGCAELGRTASDSSQQSKKVSIRFCLAATEARDGYQPVKDEQGQTLFVKPDAVLTEADVKRASLMESQRRTIILLEFKPLAADRLDRETAEHLGDRLAIFLDDRLVMSPVIRSRIEQGKAAVDGDFSKERADEIVRALNSGVAATEKPAP